MQNEDTAPAPTGSQTPEPVPVSGARLNAEIAATKAENELLRALIIQRSRSKKAMGAAA